MTNTKMFRMLLLTGFTWLLASSLALAAPRPVVLELFTSNSCSSCPLAYALLRKLQASPPTDDVQLIVLSQHVDYWNDLGWVDRYSDAQFTRRQRNYAHDVFGRGRVYTPQLVVNGRHEMLGSRGNEVRAAIREAAGQASLPVSLKITPRGDQSLFAEVTVDGRQADDAAQIWLALTQDDVVSRVGAGENRGRKLIEDGVVRLLKPAGSVHAGAVAKQHYSTALKLPAKVNRKDLSVVAFVQRQGSHVIAGATRIPVSQTQAKYGFRQ